MTKLLAGKVALVTGAGSGIGRATAEVLAAAGAHVGCADRVASAAGKTANSIHKKNGAASVLRLDVAKPLSLQRGVAAFLKKTKRLDIVVANAGINGVWAPVEKLSLKEWEQTLRVNLTGTFLTLRATLRHLKRHGGSAVIVSSVNGNRVFSNAGACAYATSKAGQVAFARMLALELAPSNVRVNTVCPGSIRTQIEDSMERRDLDKIQPKVLYPQGVVPLGKHQPGSAAQVAQLILYLVSDAASHITGTEVYIDGGESLLMG